MTKIGILKDINTNWWRLFASELEKYSIEFDCIEVEKNDWIEQVSRCSHIIWRPNHTVPYKQQAKDKLYIIEKILKKPVYPDEKTFWHYDNKNAQNYFLQASKLNVRTPQTLVSYDYDEALEFLRNTEYPIISKSSHGAGGSNVRILRNSREGENELNVIFSKNRIINSVNWRLKRIGYKVTSVKIQDGYVYYQSFIKNNNYDTRVIVIGNKCFALRRMNRTNDFRASGSNNWDHDPSIVDVRLIRLSLDISEHYRFQTMAYDFLLSKTNTPVLIEMSYTFPDGAFFNNCPGYWDESLQFHKRNFTAQEAIIELLIETWGLKF